MVQIFIFLKQMHERNINQKVILKIILIRLFSLRNFSQSVIRHSLHQLSFLLVVLLLFQLSFIKQIQENSWQALMLKIIKNHHELRFEYLRYFLQFFLMNSSKFLLNDNFLIIPSVLLPWHFILTDQLFHLDLNLMKQGTVSNTLENQIIHLNFLFMKMDLHLQII